MTQRAIMMGKKFVGKLLGRKKPTAEEQELFEKHDYLSAYSLRTDQRVEVDPAQAIGGRWEEIGELQYNFLLRKGLQPHHRMLDIGCGTLRGGQHFIAYLNPGGYTGIDISSKAIAFARQFVNDKGLADKQPRLIVNERKNLKFDDFNNEQFDYLLAQSVFTHLMPEHIEECFAHVSKVMHNGSTFYYTYQRAKVYEQTSVTDFRYPFSFFESLAERYGFHVRDVAEDYPHPRFQRMVAMRKA